MKRIVIAGLGEIGFFLAQRLSSEKFDVTVMDQNQERVHNAQNHMDVRGIVCNITNLEELKNAEIKNASLFIAATNQDEINLISCLLAKHIKIPHNISLTRYLGARNKLLDLKNLSLGVDCIINVNYAMRKEVLELIETNASEEITHFAKDKIMLLGHRVAKNSPLLGKSGEDIAHTDNHFLQLACLVRKGKILTQKNQETLKPNDYIYFLGETKNRSQIQTFLGGKARKYGRIILFGENFFSQHLTESLLGLRYKVVVILQSRKRIKAFQEGFQKNKNFTLEVGNAMDVRLLKRLAVSHADLFISAQKDDTQNLSACMLAKHLKVPRTLSVVRNSDFFSLCPKIGIDSHIAPHFAIARIVQQVVHENKMINYSAIAETNLDVFEMEVEENSKAAKNKVEKIKLPENSFLAALIRSEEVFFKIDKKMVVEPGDKVLLFSKPENTQAVEHIFSV